MKRERFDAITDAVLAIISTLMILEIKVPELSGGQLIPLFTQIGVYAISFIMICILWLNHHHIFHGTEQIDTTTVWLNFSLLFIMSLFPLATKLISESFLSHQPHIFYGAVLTVATVLYTILQDRANRIMGSSPKTTAHHLNWLATLICLSSIPLSLLSVWLSGAIFLLVPASYFLLSTRQGQQPGKS